jgi:hypothetical protein
VKDRAEKIQGNFYPKVEGKVPPEQLVFNNSDDAPNFSETGLAWTENTELYGPVQIETFRSKNNKLQYMFCRDSRNRVWIGGIENDSKITPVGLRESWINGGDLTTPAFEYYDYDGGYGSDKVRSRNYVDMYENYLSKIPVIKEYLARGQAQKTEAGLSFEQAIEWSGFKEILGEVKEKTWENYIESRKKPGKEMSEAQSQKYRQAFEIEWEMEEEDEKRELFEDLKKAGLI